MTALERWLEGRGGTGFAEAREASERVRAFIVAHGKSRFEPVGDQALIEERRSIVNRAGWYDGRSDYIAPHGWREIHIESDPARAARHLAEAGHSLPEGERSFTRKAPREVPNRPRCYNVNASILVGEEDGHEG